MRSNLLCCLLYCSSTGIVLGQIQTMTIGIHDGTGEDTFVHNGSTNQFNNYSGIGSLSIYGWTNSGQVGVKRAFLKFDLGLLPETIEVVGARLSLFYNPDDALESSDIHSGDNQWVIKRVEEEWNPATITWATQPMVNNVNEVIMPATTLGDEDFEDIEVTAIVQDMITTGTSGFRLSMMTEQPYRMLILASGEDNDPDRHPRLEVDYISTVSLPEHERGREWQANWAEADQLLVTSTGSGGSIAKLSVFDMMGRSVAQIDLLPNDLRLDAVTWPVGRYTLLIDQDRVRSVLSVVKGH